MNRLSVVCFLAAVAVVCADPLSPPKSPEGSAPSVSSSAPPPPDVGPPPPPDMPATTTVKTQKGQDSGNSFLLGLLKGQQGLRKVEIQTSNKPVPAWDVTVAPIGLEFEFDCLAVVETKEGHTKEKPVTGGGDHPLIFASLEGAEAGLNLVDVTRDMVSGNVGSQTGELEIMSGAIQYTDTAKWTGVHNFFNNFFTSIAFLRSTAEKWGEDRHDAIQVSAVYNKMKESTTGGQPTDDPTQKQFNEKYYFVQESGLCRSSPQVNFGFTIENFVKEGANVGASFYHGGVVGLSYTKVAAGVGTFLQGEKELASLATNDYLRAFIALVAHTSNVFASVGHTKLTIDVKNVPYKNRYGLLPKATFADVARAGSDEVRAALFAWHNAWKGDAVALGVRAGETLCVKPADKTGTVTEKMTNDCRVSFVDILKDSLDYTDKRHINRFKDTTSAYGPTPFDSFDKTLFSPAPKALGLGKINGKPAMVMEQRSQDQALEINVDTTTGAITWNRARIPSYGNCGTTGTFGSPDAAPVAPLPSTGVPTPPTLDAPRAPPLPSKLLGQLKTKQ